MPFHSHEFVSALAEAHQELVFSGIGAHHQNGVAKHVIKTITYWACTMMLHAILYWPEQATDLSLWLFALEHAVWLWNHLPNQHTHLAPLKLFVGTTFDSLHHLHHSHVWGCPCLCL